MSGLPHMKHRDNYNKITQIKFGGLRHSEACTDGEIYDMSNMGCEEFPVLKSVGDRPVVRRMEGQREQFYMDGGTLLTVQGSCLYYEDLCLISDLSPDWKRFVRFGDRVLLMPDKRLLNLYYPIVGMVDGEHNLPSEGNSSEAYAVRYGNFYNIHVWDGEQWVNNGRFDTLIDSTTEALNGVSFENGEIYGEAAQANTIRLMMGREEFKELGFREGDAIEIRGCKVEPRNNKIPVLREIAGDDKHCLLRFTEHCFYLPEDGAYTEDGVTISRTMPDVDVLFENANRLWGAKGDEIFASAVGDPRNWNVFDGTSLDSFYCKTQSKGEIHGGYGDYYPRFLKEDSMITVYGQASFQLSEQKLPGVMKGEMESVAFAGGYALWLSNEGMVLFNGSNYTVQHEELGHWALRNVVGCSAGSRAYFATGVGLLCFDSHTGLWTKETNWYGTGSGVLGYDGGAVYGIMTDDGESSWLEIVCGDGRQVAAPTGAVLHSFVEFGDFTEQSPNRKAMNRLELRLGLEQGSEVTALIQYDSNGEWVKLWTIGASGTVPKKSYAVPVIPRRCDHYRLKLVGKGAWKLYSMARIRRVGSGKG